MQSRFGRGTRMTSETLMPWPRLCAADDPLRSRQNQRATGSAGVASGAVSPRQRANRGDQSDSWLSSGTRHRGPARTLLSLAMSNIVSGRQIRAARILAGLTQADLARAAGYHPRSVRYWESKGNNPPTNVASTMDNIEQALIGYGVIPFSTPTPGVRLL
jgi:DNA-binding transcriptional regulator YiaG